MSDAPNPPLAGVFCHCGAELFLVDAVNPERERARLNSIIGPVGQEVPDTAKVREWVCAAGHRVGVSFDHGDLDIGLVRDTTLAEPVPPAEFEFDWQRDQAPAEHEFPPTSPLHGFDHKAARAAIVGGAREFYMTTFRCGKCGRIRQELFNALEHHLLVGGGPAAPSCHLCRPMARNDFHIFQEEFTGLTAHGIASTVMDTDAAAHRQRELDRWVRSHVDDDPTVQGQVTDYRYGNPPMSIDEYEQRNSQLELAEYDGYKEIIDEQQRALPLPRPERSNRARRWPRSF